MLFRNSDCATKVKPEDVVAGQVLQSVNECNRVIHTVAAESQGGHVLAQEDFKRDE